MANQGGTHEQHVKAGQQSHKNDSKDRSASSGGRNAQSREPAAAAMNSM